MRLVHTFWETSVTGGTVVRKDDSSITIKELETDELRRFLFIDGGIFFETADDGVQHFADTEVIVNDQTTTKDEIKVGMRAQIVFYTSVEPWKDEKSKFMKSVKAISGGKQKPAK